MSETGNADPCQVQHTAMIMTNLDSLVVYLNVWDSGRDCHKSHFGNR